MSSKLIQNWKEKTDELTLTSENIYLKKTLKTKWKSLVTS
jgi:hypothetical protein